MKKKKSPGPTGLTSDIIKLTMDCGLAGLFEVPKVVWDSGLSPFETVTFYKRKGDPLVCDPKEASDY